MEKLKETISEKILKHQEILENVLEKAPEQAKLGIENAIEISQKGFEKAIEVVSKENKEPEKVCAQVITPAIDPKTNICKEFPTPCDVPPGWGVTNRCPTIPTSSAPSKSSAPAISPTPLTSPKPSTLSEPIPKEIRYYTCPDGTKVESGKCSAGGGCIIQMTPESQCPAPTPPVPQGGVCATAGEIKYYQCPSASQVSQVPWCACGAASPLAGAKNIWRCQRLPELSCPKPAPIPTPVPELVACYLDETCITKGKEECLSKGGSPTSDKSCPQSTSPAEPPAYSSCTK